MATTGPTHTLLAACLCVVLFGVPLQAGANRGGNNHPGGGPKSKPAGGGKASVDRLEKMKPEERKKALGSLPDDRRKRVEQQLEEYKKLPPEQKKALQQEYDRFQQLPKDQQDTLRKMGRRLNELPPDRQQAVKGEVSRLRRMSPAERAKALSSDDLRQKYSGKERNVIETLATNLPD